MPQVSESRQRANRFVIEGFVIVVSVLLAFSIDAWWDRTQQEAAEAEWIAAVQLDLETSLGQLEETIGKAPGALLVTPVVYAQAGPAAEFRGVREPWPCAGGSA